MRRKLRSRTPAVPEQEQLAALFACLFATSLRTEEGVSPKIQIAWVDRNDPDPHRPERIVHDRWESIPLASPRPVSVEEFVKLASASDPRSSLFAIDSDGDSLKVWGLVDQQDRRHDFINREGDRGFPPPGVFQAQIEGIGHLTVWDGYARLAELHANEIRGPATDLLSRGPVREALEPGIARHRNRVFRTADASPAERSGYRVITADLWLATLSRILLRVQNYHHGGAILITPSRARRHLDVKYQIEYRRLPTALDRRALHRIENDRADDTIVDEYMEAEEDLMPILLHLDSNISSWDLEESASELDGTTRFISLLTRVDGLVLMTPDLAVRGFGVEITASRPPNQLLIAADDRARETREGRYDHYGTRHRSMMRYVAATPNSVGFVVSQDGDVRCVMKMDDSVVLWEDVKLQHEFDTARFRRRRSR